MLAVSPLVVTKHSTTKDLTTPPPHPTPRPRGVGVQSLKVKPDSFTRPELLILRKMLGSKQTPLSLSSAFKDIGTETKPPHAATVTG